MLGALFFGRALLRLPAGISVGERGKPESDLDRTQTERGGGGGAGWQQGKVDSNWIRYEWGGVHGD